MFSIHQSSDAKRHLIAMLSYPSIKNSLIYIIFHTYLQNAYEQHIAQCPEMIKERNKCNNEKCQAIILSLNDQLENLTNLDQQYAGEKVQRDRMIQMLRSQIQEQKDKFKQELAKVTGVLNSQTLQSARNRGQLDELQGQRDKNQARIAKLRQENNQMAEQRRRIQNEIEESQLRKTTLEKDLETKYKCKNGHKLGPVRNQSDTTTMCDGCLKPCINKDKVNFYFKCDKGCNTDYCPCCFQIINDT